MPLVDQRLEGVELVGGMHRLALDVLGKADFRGVGYRRRGRVHGMAMVRLDGSGFREGFEREKPAASGDDGVFAALVFADDKRLQKAVRGDGRGQLVDALVGDRSCGRCLPRREAC